MLSNKRARNSRRALRDLNPPAVDTVNSRNLRVTHRLAIGVDLVVTGVKNILVTLIR